MKNVFYLLILCLVFSCTNTVSLEVIKQKYKIVTIDGCEYVTFNMNGGGYAGYGYMAHKGNCQTCAKIVNKQMQVLMDSIRVRK